MPTINWLNQWNDFLDSHPILQIPEGDVFKLPADVQPSADNEQFWEDLLFYYPPSTRPINLNNGAVSTSPLIVEKAFTYYYSLLNSSPSYYTWKVMETGREVVRSGLAHLIGATADEISIHRNATESLNNAIFGIPLSSGDEVVVCKQDYLKTVSSWNQRALREGIVLQWVQLTGSENDDEIISKYVSLFGPKTKVLNLTHMINWNGRILPVEPIIREAKARGILVILDAAHSFGVLDIDVSKLQVDYLGTALHKWLSGPIPSGMLYVRKELIGNTWPLASAVNPTSDNVRKFEELSIQLMPNILGLGFAIEFHLRLGRAEKEARLRHIRKFWVDEVKDKDYISFKTPFKENNCLVIVNMLLKGWEPLDLEKKLLTDFGIHVSAVTWENMKGIRVTPNLYTLKKDLLTFVSAIQQLRI